MKVLLIEPNYKNKYPPIALMKLSTYHKELNDDVVFCKGKNTVLKSQKWDRIYISTVFTFHWKQIVNTIEYYLGSVENNSSIIVGGSMATIMENELLQHEGLDGIKIIKGLLDKPGQLDEGNSIIIDELIPDYDIIDTSKNEYLNYEYKVKNAYFIHATRGCVRNCVFCAVPIIEPCYKGYIDIKRRIAEIDEKYGAKCDLMMMDNNILASPKFTQIIDDIISCGYEKDKNFYYYSSNNGIKRKKKKYVDFNQGVDARVIYKKPDIMKQLGRIAVRPLRIAFDHVDEEFVKIYKHCMELAAENSIKELSNYILYNYDDTPDDLYVRLEINLKLNQQFENKGFATRIWSFPMRYTPQKGEHAKDRKYIGEHWTRKQIRGVQCILNATHGMVGPKYAFFCRAFGNNLNDFNRILWMPEELIINRVKNEMNGNTAKWNNIYSSLSNDELYEFKTLISPNNFKDISSENNKIESLLSFYRKIAI